MYYIQEADKPNFLLEFFNVIKRREDKIILPIIDESISTSKAEKLAKKTKEILDKTNCNKLIISKKLKKQEDYINNLYTYNIEIINGKWLFELLSCQVLEYITKIKNIKNEETQISILINEISEIMLENMKQIVEQYKKVNIVTNHIEKFRKIEQQILKEKGIMITVNNNKRKSIQKSKIILNVDFPTELINQYHIYDEAMIINLKGNVKINKKRFNGININNYQISFYNLEGFEHETLDLYELKDIYEAQMYKRQPFENIMRKVKRDKVKITKLIANNTLL